MPGTNEISTLFSKHFNIHFKMQKKKSSFSHFFLLWPSVAEVLDIKWNCQVHLYFKLTLKIGTEMPVQWPNLFNVLLSTDEWWEFMTCLCLHLFSSLLTISHNLQSAAFTCSADVTGGVRGPGDAVDTRTMVVQPSHRSAGHTYVQDDHLSRRNINANMHLFPSSYLY